MAAYASTEDSHKDDKSFAPSKRSHDDQQILQQPYAEALTLWGYQPELIISAVKSLRKQHKSVSSRNVLLIIDELEKNKSNQSPPERKVLPRNGDIGSDGESDNSSLEYVDAIPPPGNDGDLFTDAEPPITPLPIEPPAGVHDPRAVQKSKDKARGGTDTALQQKLQALRSENRRLKERQLCQSCHSQPTSITFLPCGHYAYCYDCGQRFSACPICRKTILADVRTFLA